MPWPGPGYYRVSQNTWALRDDLNMTERLNFFVFLKLTEISNISTVLLSFNKQESGQIIPHGTNTI